VSPDAEAVAAKKAEVKFFCGVKDAAWTSWGLLAKLIIYDYLRCCLEELPLNGAADYDNELAAEAFWSCCCSD